MKKLHKILNNKFFPFIFLGIFAVLVSFFVAVGLCSCNLIQSNEDETIISDNTFVFNPETAEEEILSVDDNSMTIKTIYGLNKGSILSTGITSKTPHGTLRKVTSIEKVDSGYKVNTEPAALTEAIQQCSLHYTANIKPNGTYDIVERTENNKVNSSVANSIIQTAYADGTSIGQEFKFDSKLFTGKFGYSINFDCDIHLGHIYLKVTGEIYATAELKDFTKIDTGDIDLPCPDLPDVTFWAGIVPVVITNDLGLSCRGVANLKSLKIQCGCTIDKVAGFEYCNDWGVRPVCEDKSWGPTLSIYAEKDTFRGTLSANITASYTGKLYGAAGFTISVGAVDDFNFHLKKLLSGENSTGCIHVPGLNWDLKGTLKNKVYIPIAGNFTMGGKVDIFGLTFKTDELNIELFNTNDSIVLYDQELTFGNLNEDPDFNAINQIALVLDVSGSMMGDPLKQLQSACVQFINSTDLTNASVSIIGFETIAQVYIEDSDDKTLLLDNINKLKDLGSTNIEDGLSKADTILSKKYNSKKSIVLMSDGLPNEGKTDSALVSYADSLKNKGITIYTLGFFHSVSGSKTSPQKLMEDISSPGFHYEADSASSLQEFFDQISSQIKGTSYYYVQIHCPVDVKVTYNGETLSSVSRTAQRRSFGSLSFEDEENSVDKTKILRLIEGPSYDLDISGYGSGVMNYSIGYVNDQGQYDDTRYFDDIKVNSSTKISTKANLTDTNELYVDDNGDGQNIDKYEASKNEHAKIVQEPINNNDNQNLSLSEQEEDLGFLEKLMRDINRFYNDLFSFLWYQVTQ